MYEKRKSAHTQVAGRQVKVPCTIVDDVDDVVVVAVVLTCNQSIFFWHYFEKRLDTYIVFLQSTGAQSASQSHSVYPLIHNHTPLAGCRPAKCYQAHQEQFRVQSLTQGHFHKWTAGAGT